MNVASTSPKIAIADLRGDFAGRVIGPEDADYDQARTVVLRRLRRPAGGHRPGRRCRRRRTRRRARRARPGSSWPSAAAATAAPATARPTAASSSTCAGMKALDIDADGRTAWAETGLTAAEYSTPPPRAHGLATGFGDTGSVGIGGITLGGGVGYLVRKHGLTIDDLLAAEVVTADGQLLRVDAEHAPRPVLGDPRRRRQLRRRDAVPVPAPRASPRSSAGC